jgi:hypothetical protein
VNSDQVLRIINGLIAGWLGYLGAGLFLDGAGTAGVAAGFGVLGYLLPRLAALSLLVVLVVVLWRNGVGFGLMALSTVLGGIWVAAGGSSPGLSRLPLGPVLAVPLAATVIGAVGLPLLFGALMRPLGAALSAATAVLTLITYDLTYGDGTIDYLGLQPGTLPTSLGPETFLQNGQALLLSYPALMLQAALWAFMAGIISLAEWLGRPLAGLAMAVGCGTLGYLLLAPQSQNLNQAMISLGVAAIIYGSIRYLGSRVRG